MAIDVDRGVELELEGEAQGRVQSVLEELRSREVVIRALDLTHGEGGNVLLLAEPLASVLEVLDARGVPFHERGFVTLPFGPEELGLEVALRELEEAGVTVRAVLHALRRRGGITLAVDDPDLAARVLGTGPVHQPSGRDVER